MTTVDSYIVNVNRLGDTGSAYLNKRCAETLLNSEFVEILENGMNGLSVLRLPEDRVVVVHSFYFYFQ